MEQLEGRVLLNAQTSDLIPTNGVSGQDSAVVANLNGGESSLLPSLSGLHVVMPSQVQGQIIYLDFTGASDVSYDGPVKVNDVDVPAFKAPTHLAGMEQTIAALVVDQLNVTFAGSGVSFTTQKPEDGTAYSTVYVGGDGTAIAGDASLAGVAEQVDAGNLSSTDEAFVFSDNLTGTDGVASYVTNLSAVVSHEVGHLLGYAHNTPGAVTTALSEVAAEIQGVTWLDSNGNGTQDSGEAGIAGWTVSLNNGLTTTTDANGQYEFTDLTAGTYTVSEQQVAGWSQTAPSTSTSSSLDHAWGVTTSGATSTSKAEATLVETDASGNVIMAGTYEGTVDLGTGAQTSKGSSDIFVRKLNADGTTAWVRTIGGMSTESVDGIVLDASGNIYLSGSFGSAVDFNPTSGTDVRTAAGNADGYLLKLNADGSYGWVKTFGGEAAFARVYGVALDTSNNLYLTGTFSQRVDFNPTAGTDYRSSDAAGSASIFVTRINADGTYGWTRTMGGNGIARGTCISVDSSGDVYISGHFLRTVDFNPGSAIENLSSSGDWDMFLTKLKTNGDYVWTKQIGGADWDMVYDMKVDASDNVYLAGLFSLSVDFNPGTGTDFQSSPYRHVGSGFVTRINADGSYGWTRTLTSDSQRMAATGLSLDGSGNVYVVGEEMALADDAQIDTQSTLFLARFGTDGQVYWTREYSDLAPTQTDVFTPSKWDVATSSTGEVYVVGRFNGSIDFDPSVGADRHTAGGTYDAFIIKETPVSSNYTVTLTTDQVVQEINFGNRLTSSVEGLAPVVNRLVVEDPTASVAGARISGWSA